MFWSLKEALSKVLAKAVINRILQISGFTEFDGKVHGLWWGLGTLQCLDNSVKVYQELLRSGPRMGGRRAGGCTSTRLTISTQPGI